MAKNDKIMPQEELSFLCGQLAMMLRAGIPLADGVGMLRENFQDAPGGRVLESMEEVLGRGGTFREAAERAGVFPAYMTGMVEVGERAGRLEQVLEGLSTHYRREARVRESIRAAVAYPLVLAGIMAVVMGILLVGVLPVFSRAFASLGVQGRRMGGVGGYRGGSGGRGGVPPAIANRSPVPGLGPVLPALPLRPPCGGMPERLPVCLGDFPDASERL